jgi:hypothetical protein
MTEKQFKQLSWARKRVAIAEDVKKWLNVMKLQPGVYLDYYGSMCNYVTPEDFQKKLRDPNFMKDCAGCARGAMFLSHVRINNHLSFGETFCTGQDFSAAKMQEYFTDKELRRIEMFFEGWAELPSNDPETRAKVERFVAGSMKYPDPAKARLRALMNNIIRNKGEFTL